MEQVTITLTKDDLDNIISVLQMEEEMAEDQARDARGNDIESYEMSMNEATTMHRLIEVLEGHNV